MFHKPMKRLMALACVLAMLFSNGAALALGGAIGNTIDDDDDALYSELINGRKIARKAFLSDRYPTIDGGLRVFHNEWTKGGWEEYDAENCRISGRMMLADSTYLKGIGMYLDGYLFRSSAEGSEAVGSVRYTLNGDYDEFYFSIGPDCSDSRYCGSDDGTARIQIYADKVLVYETDFFDYDDAGFDQAINVKGVNKLQIVLTIYKGSNNTLNVLLTNPLLVDFS